MGQRGQAVHARHRQIEQHEARAKPARLGDRFRAVRRLPDDIEAVLSEERGQCLSREWVIVSDQDALHRGLIGSTVLPIRGMCKAIPRTGTGRGSAGELLLVCLLGLGTVLLVVTNRLDGYALPNARIALDTAVAIVASIVALLAAIRFLVEGRGMDLLLAAGFLAIGLGTAIFAVVPVVAVNELAPVEAWAAIGAALLGTALIALAPFVTRRVTKRRRALAVALGIVAVALVGVWVDSRVLGLEFDLGPTGGRALGLGDRRLRAPHGALAHRGRRLRVALSTPRARSRQLAHARTHARRLRRPPLRSRARSIE